MNVDSCFFSLIESLLPNCFIENIWPKSKLLNERTELVELKNISKKYITFLYCKYIHIDYRSKKIPCQFKLNNYLYSGEDFAGHQESHDLGHPQTALPRVLLPHCKEIPDSRVKQVDPAFQKRDLPQVATS